MGAVLTFDYIRDMYTLQSIYVFSFASIHDMPGPMLEVKGEQDKTQGLDNISSTSAQCKTALTEEPINS